MFMLLAVACWVVCIFAVVFAALVHVVNNAKRSSKTVWQNDVNAICAAVAVIFYLLADWLWGL